MCIYPTTIELSTLRGRKSTSPGQEIYLTVAGNLPLLGRKSISLWQETHLSVAGNPPSTHNSSRSSPKLPQVNRIQNQWRGLKMWQMKKWTSTPPPPPPPQKKKSPYHPVHFVQYFVLLGVAATHCHVNRHISIVSQSFVGTTPMKCMSLKVDKVQVLGHHFTPPVRNPRHVMWSAETLGPRTEIKPTCTQCKKTTLKHLIRGFGVGPMQRASANHKKLHMDWVRLNKYYKRSQCRLLWIQFKRRGCPGYPPSPTKARFPHPLNSALTVTPPWIHCMFPCI